MPAESTLSLCEEAVFCGNSGHSCSEAILVTYGPEFGLGRDESMRIASGLAGGIGHSKGICGAVSAACMVIGLAIGPTNKDQLYERQRSVMLCGEFIDRYSSLHGSVQCSQLCFKNLPADAGPQELRSSGIPEKLIRDAAELIETLLEET